MTDLEQSIAKIIDTIQVIPSSQGYWVNRTDDGKYYDLFLDKKIIGLRLDDVKLSDLEKIRRESMIRNRLILDKAQQGIHNLLREKNERKLRETLDKQEKTNLQREISTKANQIFSFAFKQKKFDYVAVPSSNSEFISVGQVRDSYLDDPTHLPLQRKINWIGEFRKAEMDTMIYKAFSSHLAFFDISKYKDLILRSLYDFYIEDENGNFVLNLGYSGKIPFRDESSFLYYFTELFGAYLERNKLSYDLQELGTIVNLNSKGKRKLFGKPGLVFLAALFLVVATEDIDTSQGKYNSDLDNVINSMDTLLQEGSNKVDREDLKNAARKMQVDKSTMFKRIIDDVDQQLDSLDQMNKRINRYY